MNGSRDEQKGDMKQSPGKLEIIDVLGSKTGHEESTIHCPNVHKLSESALVQVVLQSNTEKVRKNYFSLIILLFVMKPLLYCVLLNTSGCCLLFK